jgi:hypothetical protein
METAGALRVHLELEPLMNRNAGLVMSVPRAPAPALTSSAQLAEEVLLVGKPYDRR